MADYFLLRGLARKKNWEAFFYTYAPNGSSEKNNSFLKFPLPAR